MVALILAAFVFSLQYLPLVLADTTLLPALKFEAEPRNALIRGLIDREIDKRQYSYCPAPMYRCEYSHCCPNTNHPCCRGGTCCWPNTYCALASNGNIGCCPVGEVCSGPVNDPRTIFHTYTTTSTRTSTSEYTFDIPTTTAFPNVPSSSDSTTPSTSSTTPTPPPAVNFPTVKTPTTSSASSAGNSTLNAFPSDQSTTAILSNFAQSTATKVTENAVFLVAISTFYIMMVL